ncbi:AraC family transcriptional regulator [Paenibacillus sp. HB172176]|uniref:AraC family transcriptional regulator n=1 Tax=Paenibacillus sp. HB172176 TaxID=2493690 RepID=UPI00143B45AB|nr:AraC family transcriptional regulator [Paenibacillus sp. HB172176]
MNILNLTVPPLPHFIIGGTNIMPPGRKHPARRDIGAFDLIIVTKGCLYIGEEDRHYEVMPGCMLILRPDLEHYATRACEEETFYYWIHFQSMGSWSMPEFGLPDVAGMQDMVEPIPISEQFAVRSFVKRLPQFAKLSKLGQLEDMLETLTEMSNNDHIPGVRWKQQLLFQEVVQHLSASVEARPPTPAGVCAEKAASYLRKHYKEDITAQKLGETINFHPVYIARCMKREFGCSPVDYLMRIRIEQAKLLLLQTDLTIMRIAEEVGFNRASYFASCFAKHEGLSPRAYRQRFLVV